MARTQKHTNSVIITNVPPALFEEALNASLRAHFERLAGSIRLWAPMPTFARILAVYASSYAANQAKTLLDKSVIEDAASDTSQGEKIPRQVMRVYTGPQTPEYLIDKSAASEKHLPVPVTDKNFLISPPGSPPVGWEQIKEDPPNTVTLADDLMRALENLTLEQKLDSEPATPAHSRTASLAAAMTQGSVVEEPAEQLVIPPSPDRHHPAVLVSNMDAGIDINASSTTGITLANTPRGVLRSPSPRPPPISHVKATVDSMHGSSTSSSSSQRITPTARPPF